MDVKLLPCPFNSCGGPAVLESKREIQECAPDDGYMVDAYVWCHECGARGPHFYTWAHDDVSEALVLRDVADGWNRRSPDFDAVLKDRDALQGKLKVAVDELSTSGCKPDAASDCKLCRLLAQIGLPEKEG